MGYSFLIINFGEPNVNVGTSHESRASTCFENEFTLKYTSHESILLPKTHELVTHTDVKTHMENHEVDNNVVT